MSEQGFSVRLSARIDQFLAAMDQAKKATRGVGDDGTANFQKLGAKMQDVGMTMSTHVSLPLIAAGGLAVKMSSDFEGAFGRMVGLAGVEAGEVDGLKKSVLDLAGDTAKAPQELADALYEASSAGLDTAEAMDAVKVAAKASAAGMGSAQDIVGLVASATAAYGSANIDAARATDILTAAIREGRADPAELAGTLGRVLPIANQLGVSFEEVGGATAYLSNVFGDTNRTVTALQGFLVKLVSPSEQGRKALLEMGTSAEELKKSIDEDGLMGALELLKSHGFEANAEAMAKLFDDIEGRQGALALMADESGHLQEIMDATANSAGSLDSAFSAVADTSGFKMKQAWADIQVALIQAGDVIMPIVTGVAGGIADLASGFADLPKPVQMIIIGFLGLVAAAGPVLMISGSMVKNFKEVKAAFTGMSSGAGVAAGALGALGLVMIAATAWYSDNARKKAELLAITNDFVTALNAEKDGQKGAVDAAITKGLSDQKLIDNAKVLGLSVSDMAKVVRGESVPAFEKLQEAAEHWTFTAGNAVNISATLGKEVPTDEIEAMGRAFSYVSGHLAPLNDGLENAQDQIKTTAQVERELAAGTAETDRETRRLTAGLVEHKDAAEDLSPTIDKVVLSEAQLAAIEKQNTEATKSMSDALDDSTNSFEVLAGAASLLKKALDAVFGGAQTLEDANETLIAAVDATTASIKENGRTLDIMTEKGRNNRDAIQEQANAALDQGVAMVGMGASQEEATAAINGNITALRDQLLQAGLTEEQVDAYITTLGLTPEQVNTAIVLADTEATKLRIKDLQDRLGVIDAPVAAEIQALIEEGSFAEAERRLATLLRRREVKLSIIAGGSDTAAGYGDGTRAVGGPVLGGRTYLVGERGPELLKMGGDGYVYPNSSLPTMMSGPMTSAMSVGLTGGSGSTSAGPVSNHKTVQFTGDIHQEVDIDAAFRLANFYLAAA